MKSEKKLAVLIITAVSVTLLIIGYLYTYSPFEEDGEFAIVRFQLFDEKYFRIRCEVASTPKEQVRGLMYRKNLPLNRGMLFVYGKPRRVTIWMKNILMPLDIVFIDEDGVVTKVEEAYVETGVPDNELTRYRSYGDVKWVVEMNRGLSSLYGIDKGTKVLIEHY